MASELLGRRHLAEVDPLQSREIGCSVAVRAKFESSSDQFRKHPCFVLFRRPHRGPPRQTPKIGGGIQHARSQRAPTCRRRCSDPMRRPPPSRRFAGHPRPPLPNASTRTIAETLDERSQSRIAPHWANGSVRVTAPRFERPKTPKEAERADWRFLARHSFVSETSSFGTCSSVAVLGTLALPTPSKASRASPLSIPALWRLAVSPSSLSRNEPPLVSAYRSA